MQVNKIKHMMLDKDLSYTEVAKRMGVHVSHVSNILSRNNDIKTSTLKKLCKALGCKAEDIW